MDTSPERPTLPQFLLGVFVLGQLVFMFAGNLINLFDLGRPPLAPPFDLPPPRYPELANFARGTRLACETWSSVTLQQVYWGLFASYPPQAPFPAARLTVCDGNGTRSIDFHSPLEPADPSHYCDLNPFWDRMHHYELWLMGSHWPKRMVEPGEETDTDRYLRNVMLPRNWKPMQAYAHWLARNQGAWQPGGAPPAEMVFYFRIYDIPPPGQPDGALRPRELLALRWRPGTELPVELFDLREQRFVPLKTDHE